VARIVVERGNERGHSLELDGAHAETLVGRLKTNTLVVTDYLISRQHFKIRRAVDGFFISDLHSHNGTFLDDVRLDDQEHVLQEGALIRAGNTLFKFHLDNRAPEGLHAGKRLGGYQLITRIGLGGMSEVYLATQLSLGRQVALKLLSPELTKDHAFVEKFEREARAAGKFNHPNVVQVHEVGHANGIYYYSMEYLEGGSVQEMISKGRKLPPVRATEIILQAARALEYAERAGIVHCDVKPDNLMLTASGDVRLADLGIAKSLNAKGKAEQSEGVFGSPNYMSPEQARGFPLDHRSDLFSLGATFYRMLLGKAPFTGRNAKMIMERVVFEEPTPPHQLDNTLPPPLYPILAKLMRKKPAERYQNAAGLIKDLEAAMQQIRAGNSAHNLATALQSRPVPFKRRIRRL
jgi:serine/threonine-protein kinase